MHTRAANTVQERGRERERLLLPRHSGKLQVICGDGTAVIQAPAAKSCTFEESYASCLRPSLVCEKATRTRQRQWRCAGSAVLPRQRPFIHDSPTRVIQAGTNQDHLPSLRVPCIPTSISENMRLLVVSACDCKLQHDSLMICEIYRYVD